MASRVIATGLAAATSYSYRVRATDAAGNLSGYSNVASATTGSTPPPIAFVQGNFATPQSPTRLAFVVEKMLAQFPPRIKPLVPAA